MKLRPSGTKKLINPPPASKNYRPPVRHGYFKSFDGTRLFYSIEGKGKPLVFCYGLVCSSLHWTYQIEYFSRRYQAIWFDYRGHQNSDIPRDLRSLTLENLAKDLGILLDELEIPKAVLLGHSMGTNVVLELARQKPERVAGLVLANGTPKPPLETLFNRNLLQGGFKLLRATYEKFPQLVTRLWGMQKSNPIYKMMITLGGFNPSLTPREDIDLYIQQVSEMDPRIMIHLIENYDQHDATAWLHTLRAPTLILAGDQDKIIPLQQQELLHQLILGSRLEVLRHGSHCPQMDLPDLVNHKIENFLSEVYVETSMIEESPNADFPLQTDFTPLTRATSHSRPPGINTQSAQGKRQSIQREASIP